MVDKTYLKLFSGYERIIISVGVIVLLILGFMPSDLFWVIIKIVVGLGLVFAVFTIFAAPTTGDAKNGGDDFPDMEEENQDWLQLENDQDVEKAFSAFLENTLQLIKKVMVSDTVGLLFANYSKKQFTIRKILSDSPEQLISGNSFDILKGLPSLILRNRTPLIENHLPESPEILPYYRIGENPSRSFIGVPIYFNDLIIGVLCADSQVEEAYSSDDLQILQQFARLITVQLLNSNKLYEYETENWVANVLYQVSQEINQINGFDELWRYLLSKVPEIVPCDRVSIARRTEDGRAEIVALSAGIGNVKIGKQIPLTEGIIGWVIRKNQPLMVEDFSGKEKYVPRFFAEETPAKEFLSLLSVPVSADGRAVAAICLEAYKADQFKEQHKQILQTLANLAASIFSKIQIIEHLKQTNERDAATGLSNRRAFYWLFPRLLRLADDSRLPVFVLFLRLSFQLKTESEESRQKTIREFLTLLLPSLPENDYIFRLFSDTFAVMSLSKKPDDLLKEANDLLAKVSGKKVWADGEADRVRLNIGILDRAVLSANVEEVLENGRRALEQAEEKGGSNFVILQQDLKPI